MEISAELTSSLKSGMYGWRRYSLKLLFVKYKINSHFYFFIYFFLGFYTKMTLATCSRILLKTKSNLIEIQRIETATYSNKAYFPGEHFLYFWEIKRLCKTLLLIIIVIIISILFNIPWTLKEQNSLICTFVLLSIVFKVPQISFCSGNINEWLYGYT